MKLPSFKELIVFENENYILITKPSFVASLNERDMSRSSVVDMARDYFAESQLCHRLDKETSGIMAIAKHQEAYRNMAIQFEKRQVQKIYHAVVDGVHHFNNTEVNHAIAVSGKGTVRIDALEGKPSRTVFNTLKVYRFHTLVECQPETGRMHQIRIHLATLKAPITADLVYGGKYPFLSELKRKFNLKKGTQEEALIKRVVLHAKSLRFTDLDGTVRTIETPYAKDIRAFLSQLDKSV